MEGYNETNLWRLQLYICYNLKNWDIFLQPLLYAHNCQVHRSNAKTAFWLVFSRHPPAPTIFDRPTALPPDADSTTNPVVLRQCIVAQLANIRMKVSETLARIPACYERYIHKKVGSLSGFTVEHSVYVNRTPLNIFSADYQTYSKYNKLMPRTTASCKVLDIREHILTIDENGIANTISNDRAAPVCSQNRPRLFKRKKFKSHQKLAQRPTR